MSKKRNKAMLYPISYGSRAIKPLSKNLSNDELKDLIKRCHYISALYKKDGAQDKIKRPFTSALIRAFREDTSGTSEVVEEAVISPKYKFVYKSKREVNKEYDYILFTHAIFFCRSGESTAMRFDKFERLVKQFEEELARREANEEK